MIYLDNSATAPIIPSVAEEVCTLSKDEFYNISSSYSRALETEKLFLSAQKTVAKFLGASPDEIIFTSGGTESDNTALSLARPNSEVIVSAIEHHAILNCERTLKDKNVKMIICPVERDGRVSKEKLVSLITENTSIVSIMHVNNELGSVNDIGELARAVKEKNKNVLFHSDGVQAFMHEDSNVKRLGVDLYSVSAHKVHGPKGVGALFVKNSVPFKAFIQGGGQQKDMRSGTVNVPSCVGFASALEFIGAQDKFVEKLQHLKDVCKNELLSEDYISEVCPSGAPNILSVCVSGVRASTLQNALEDTVLIGKGSACTSRTSKISHVLDAIGMQADRAESVIRISFGLFNTEEEILAACNAIKEKSRYLKKYVRK